MEHRCLCCNKFINNPTPYEAEVSWHKRCIKSFFGTDQLPSIDWSKEAFEKLADAAVNKKLTVPGVQRKLSLHLEKDKRAGKLTIVDYPTGYILKPQSPDFAALPEAEYVSMQMAREAGVSTAACALLKVEGEYAYITKRMDRKDGQMHAMEDFCQLSRRQTADKYKSSYENCGKIVERYAKNTGLDMTELFYRLLFCFVTGNSDMHLKNFSLIEDRPGSRIFGLSAAYDLLPVNVIMPADKEQMALTLNGKKKNIKKNDFLKLAESMHMQKMAAERLISRIVGYEEEFLQETDRSYLPEEMKTRLKELIEVRMKTLK